jgi:hypothetical protein
MADPPAGVREARHTIAIPPGEASAPRWNAGPVETPPYSTPSRLSVDTWPVRSIVKACVTDTIRSLLPITAGSQMRSIG